MLKMPVIHPQILDALGRAGHLSTILITDGHYPHGTHPNRRAPVVWANFRPGLISAVDALELVCDAVPIEAATLMQPAREGAFALKEDPPIWNDYRRVLRERAGFTEPLAELQKPQFNELARSDDLGLVIATGETQGWANLLLTIGVVRVGW